MAKPINPSELLEFVSQSPGDDGDDDRPSTLDGHHGEPARVIVVGFKVPYAELVGFSLKLMLAAVPVALAAAAAVYAALKYLPKFL
ncbi:MAG: hypothetical protein HQK81_13600 [Desulfovibrionaceae bacterium]|nr:hypothetical protein [Desulfovibrionaceae bacterium]MBF0515078.1 hypothetical protein [Desulfovibrionaceae bacterium]